MRQSYIPPPSSDRPERDISFIYTMLAGKFGDHLITIAEYMPEFVFKDDVGTLYALADRGARTKELYDAYGWRVIGLIANEWVHVWHPQKNEYGFVLQEDVVLD